ncbi:NAD(P)/FAD-dependent oxidoreductase [Mangrovibrevibacter kandeliae]|uniref:NAD(P)/FAD-dependent oxidoreductase n=1 Tax=Mangrovibrevibacter kandeliae TaxID=2968473 RepID=UPI0021196F07|nr:FAD-binding oxidoreductase [Aurantimonas sp. CSK15Z-1]MCQ8780773.1 FAD-binding oxidoreductase [Aurantimonas sp. CSK15Z-1]
MPEAAHQSPISPGRSFYEDTVGERPRYPALTESLEADVLVVGGGFTGLSAACHLASAGVRTVLLEAHRVGDGASGRNGGQMGTGQRLWPSEIEPAVGFERSKALFDLAEEAKAHLLDFARVHGIDMDYRPGQMNVVHKRAYLDDYRRDAEDLASRYAYPHVRVMDRAETAERLGSRHYVGGVRDTGTGHINPLKLLVGSARAATAAGARLFEDTPATALRREGNRIVAETPRGRVTAERALIATNAHGKDLNPTAARFVMPIGSFIGATEPLADPAAVLPGNEAVADSRFVVRYFRKSPDGRLLFGGREAYTSAAGDIGKHLKRQIAEIYPHLQGVQLTHAWGGSVGITMTRLPFVREVEPGITAIGGFSGHGVMLSNFTGRLYAERITGNRDRLAILEELKIPPFPGGQRLRAPLLFLAMTWFSLRDRF